MPDGTWVDEPDQDGPPLRDLMRFPGGRPWLRGRGVIGGTVLAMSTVLLAGAVSWFVAAVRYPYHDVHRTFQLMLSTTALLTTSAIFLIVMVVGRAPASTETE